MGRFGAFWGVQGANFAFLRPKNHLWCVFEAGLIKNMFFFKKNMFFIFEGSFTRSRGFGEAKISEKLQRESHEKNSNFQHFLCFLCQNLSQNTQPIQIVSKTWVKTTYQFQPPRKTLSFPFEFKKNTVFCFF